MADIYFDITDLIAYASVHATVSGIQRVEARLLATLAQAPHAENCWCVSIDPSGRGCVRWRLSDILTDDEHDDAQILSRLAEGIGRRSRRHAVRRQLNQRGLRGWKRAFGRLAIHSRLLLERSESATTIPGEHLSSLPAEATLVMLGAGWNHFGIADFIAAHARAGGRVVQCVYDLIPIVRPEYFEDKLVTAFFLHLSRAVECVSEFICISHHTREDLERFLRDRGRHIPCTVVPLAHEFHGFLRNTRGCQPHDENLCTFGSPDREFLLCVGTLEIRKNGTALLKAWLHLRAQLGEATPHLVFCGRRGWKATPFFDLLGSHDWLKTRVHVVSDATDHDIAYLHERSLCSIYPSLYEGWGLPVGEAAWFGRTCITSSNSSLPEVCGLLADYVDPESPYDIAQKVLRTVVDRDRLRHRERLLASARLRTWLDVASELHEVLHGADSQRAWSVKSHQRQPRFAA